MYIVLFQYSKLKREELKVAELIGVTEPVAMSVALSRIKVSVFVCGFFAVGQFAVRNNVSLG